MIGGDRNNIHIGIDFDNTIVTYDNVFHKYACKLGLISKTVKKNKQEIRDTIRRLSNGNDKWTELQGLVYGCYMDEAESAEGIEQFLTECRGHAIKISIISHKTIYPAKGPLVNLQEAARRWIENKSFLTRFGLDADDIVFEETLNGKLAQISKRRCTHFIDDLIEVLLHPDFPSGVRKILYAKDIDNDMAEGVLHFKDWDFIRRYFF